MKTIVATPNQAKKVKARTSSKVFHQSLQYPEVTVSVLNTTHIQQKAPKKIETANIPVQVFKADLKAVNLPNSSGLPKEAFQAYIFLNAVM